MIKIYIMMLECKIIRMPLLDHPLQQVKPLHESKAIHRGSAPKTLIINILRIKRASTVALKMTCSTTSNKWRWSPMVLLNYQKAGGQDPWQMFLFHNWSRGWIIRAKAQKVAFNDEDLFLGNKKHNSPLLMFGEIDLPTSRIMIDGGSAINVYPYALLKR